MNNERIKINETAYLDTYILHNSQEYNVGKRRPLVVVCPGGGYAFTSDREAEPIALKFNSVGLHSVVLWYTTGDVNKNTPEHALIEIAKCMKIVKENADKWLVDTEKVIVCGFSAGGHLAANLSVNMLNQELADKAGVTLEDLRLCASILCYTAIEANPIEPGDKGFGSKILDLKYSQNERFFGVDNPTEEELNKFNLVNKVSKDVPPTFMWHTCEDVLVDVSGIIKYSLALRENNVPFELHIFEKGEHGLALCDRTTARKESHFNNHVIRWFDLCMEWLSDYID